MVRPAFATGERSLADVPRRRRIKTIAVVDPEEMDATACYKLLIGSVLPRAIGWTSTVSADGISNLAPFSFKPPMVSLTIQPRADRLRPKDTLVNIQETGEFVPAVA